MSASQDQAVTFQPLGEYALPTEPTEDIPHSLFRRVKRMFGQADDQPAIADDKLRRSSLKMLDRLAEPPECRPLLEELRATLADWLQDGDSADRLKLIVLPPGNRNSLVETFARECDLTVLTPPGRTDHLDDPSGGRACSVLPGFDGDGILVIPELERWFMRHRGGLTLVRELLSRMEKGNQRCLVGCNSWAWAFLKKAVGADMILSGAMTFQAFNAERLQHWFATLALDDHEHSLEFRVSSSGELLFRQQQKELGTEDKDNESHHYFARLAARSLGIPWVAWHLWRRSLRLEKNGDDEAIADGDQAADNEIHTLWVTGLKEFSLPGSDSAQTLLVLHAVLIHGGLTVDELHLLLPATRESNSTSALVRAGLLERNGNRLRCHPAAYPAIRSGLATAGFPVDML